MEIIWHGHSCFELVSGGFSLVLDPYYHRELCGYPSSPHGGRGAVQPRALRPRLDGGGGAAAGRRADPLEVEVLETASRRARRPSQGGNRIHILRAEGLKIVHLGDLGCRLTDEQAERISGCDAITAPAGGILTIEPYAAYEICVASGAAGGAADALRRRRARQPPAPARGRVREPLRRGPCAEI